MLKVVRLLINYLHVIKYQKLLHYQASIPMSWTKLDGTAHCPTLLDRWLCLPFLAFPCSSFHRYDLLHAAFATKYGHPPSFFVRAPGRVNIIGEHIDYMGYGVLPMAIERDIVRTMNNSITLLSIHQ
jgi:hypothetical protein